MKAARFHTFGGPEVLRYEDAPAPTAGPRDALIQMKAARFHTFGGPEVLRYEDAPAPTAGPRDALIQMKAAALNHLDLWVTNGARERNIPLPHIPGSDGSGVILEAGSDVDWLKPGDRVLICPGLSCGHCQMCLSGRDNICPSYRVLGVREDGTYAEVVKVPAVNCVPIPEGLDFNEAAAIPVVFLTAWRSEERRVGKECRSR